MKIILTDDVIGLGDIGEMVNVKPGYARNFLIPRGLAVESQTASAKRSEHLLRQIEAKKKRMKGVAQDKARALQGFHLQLDLRVGGSGRVFGSISARDIATKLAEHGYELDRRRVLLSEPIKKLGEYPVNVKLHQDVETEIKVVVVARESTKEEEEKDIEAAKQSLEDSASAKAEEGSDEEDESEE